MVLVFCDIGEREINSNDEQLFDLVDGINIAVGGHAGTKEITEYWYRKALKNKKYIGIHPSYPDRENFGRKSLEISWEDLEKSLTEQRSWLPNVQIVKFHGALYHDVMHNKYLAQNILQWMLKEGIKECNTMGGYIWDYCIKNGIRTGFEHYLDRRYLLKDGYLQLMPRSHPDSLITTGEEMLKQFEYFKCCTFCVHSDTPNIVESLKIFRQKVPKWIEIYKDYDPNE